MKKNDDPKSAIDYSQGQKDAAYSVLDEIAQIKQDAYQRINYLLNSISSMSNVN